MLQTSISLPSTHFPFSSDPADYDFSGHHFIFRSTYASLLSSYSKNSLTGQIAKNWDNNIDHTQWTMYFNDDLFYSNGERITIEDVYQSLKRITLIQKQKKSLDGLNLLLKDKDNFKSLDEELEGLELNLEKKTISFKLNKPHKNFISMLSFGIYSISHPQNYDQKSGEWLKEINNTIYSGNYYIESIGSSSILLKKNDLNDNFGHEKKFNLIDFQYSENHKESSADIILARSSDPITKKNYDFAWRGKSGIFYLHFNSWKDKKSHWSSRKNRLDFRDFLYHELNKHNIPFSTSFLPLAINGVSENMMSFSHAGNITKNKLRLWNNLYNSNIGLKVLEILEPHLEIELINLKAKEMYQETDSSYSDKFSYDIALRVSDVLISDPLNDINFMFQSNFGIRLPDEDGDIIEELSKPLPDLSIINKKLFNQGIIIPLSHFSDSFYYNVSKINLKKYNINEHPIDFTWIGGN